MSALSIRSWAPWGHPGVVKADSLHPCCSCCRGALLLQLLDGYALRYTQMVEGCSEHMPVAELAGGARIRHIFRDIFMKGLDKLDPAK